MVLHKCGRSVLLHTPVFFFTYVTIDTTLRPSVKHLDHKANATFAVVSFIIVIKLLISYFSKNLKYHMVVNLSLQLISNKMLCHY